MYVRRKQNLCRAYGALKSFSIPSHGYAAKNAAPPWATLLMRRWRSVHAWCILIRPISAHLRTSAADLLLAPIAFHFVYKLPRHVSSAQRTGERPFTLAGQQHHGRVLMTQHERIVPGKRVGHLQHYVGDFRIVHNAYVEPGKIAISHERRFHVVTVKELRVGRIDVHGLEGSEN